MNDEFERRKLDYLAQEGKMHERTCSACGEKFFVLSDVLEPNAPDQLCVLCEKAAHTLYLDSLRSPGRDNALYAQMAQMSERLKTLEEHLLDLVAEKALRNASTRRPITG